MNVIIKPVFIAYDNKYEYKGEEEGAGLYKPVSTEYRFIVDTLRYYFGPDLDFAESNGLFTVHLLHQDEIDKLRDINEDSCDMYVYCGRCFLKFEIIHL